MDEWELNIKKPVWNPSTRELAQLFPEAKPIIRKKIRELKQKQRKLIFLRYKIKQSAHNLVEQDYYKEELLSLLLEMLYVDAPLQKLLDDLKKYTQILYFMENQGVADSVNIEKARLSPIPDFLPLRSNFTRCIWHEEKTPSLYYYANTNRVKCFGCGKYGDVIAVVMQLYNMKFLEAVNFINKNGQNP